MNIKTNWIKHLHNTRKVEINRIFHNCPANLFNNGLELGAGDGFQSKLILKYIRKLISTDYNLPRLQKKTTSTIEYLKCDAEETDHYFAPEKFDIIFSSNMLEHLPNPEKALKGMHRILKNDGIMIHLIPNSMWKFSHIAMFYPNLFVRLIEKISTPNRLIADIRKKMAGKSDILKTKTEFDDNPKSTNHNHTWIWPSTHGAYKTHWKEFLGFRKKRWLKLFKSEGFKIIKVINGPVCSGYGFGLDNIRKQLEKIGLSSSYAYITIKENYSSPHTKFFQ